MTIEIIDKYSPTSQFKEYYKRSLLKEMVMKGRMCWNIVCAVKARPLSAAAPLIPFSHSQIKSS